MERDLWNRCRYVPGGADGHYESWFQRANHPTEPLAFWIRYTIFSPRGRPGDAVGELWAILFDGGQFDGGQVQGARITAAKEVVPLAACRFGGDGDAGSDDGAGHAGHVGRTGRTGRSGIDARIGRALLVDGHLEGDASSRGHSLAWNLDYDGGQAPLLLLPRALYDRGFPKAKALVGTPNAVFRGAITVDGRRFPIENWKGSQNHNWGSRHTDSYAWGQVAGFDDDPEAFLECSTAQVRIGPLWTPRMSLVVLRTEGQEYALNSLGGALRAQGRFDFFDWRIASATADARIAVHIHAPRASFVGLRYDNPPGGSKTCLNTKLAACELTLERPGRPPRTLTTKHRAAFEILTDRGDHGAAVVA